MTRTLARTKDQRDALLRNLGRSLVLHESIVTTEAKAKAVKRLVDRWITQAKKTAHAKNQQKTALYRRLLQLTHDSQTANKLLTDIAQRNTNRVSGSVRSARMNARVGDAAPRMRLTFTDEPSTSTTDTKK